MGSEAIGSAVRESLLLGVRHRDDQAVLTYGGAGLCPYFVAYALSEIPDPHFPSWDFTLCQAGRDVIVGVREIRAGLRDYQAKLDLECGLHGDAIRVVAASDFGLLACDPALRG